MKRRDILRGALAGAAAFAIPSPLRAAASTGQPGSQTLGISRRTIEVNGKAASVFGLRGGGGSPGLRLRAGDAFNVLLRNETPEPTIIHWHGLTPPWPSDGVADAPLPLIGARADRSFNFPVGVPGTFWMHAHTLQEQLLLAAPLIVADPADAAKDEQEVVILLHDFSFSSPEELLAGLMAGTASMQHGGMDMSGDSGNAMAGMNDGGMETDINDIDYDAYLANDRSLNDPEIVPVERGGRVRVRIINGATATAFTMDFGELEGELIAVDGQHVEPIRGRRFPLTMGQRIDVRLQLPRDLSSSFPILALREGSKERTGIVLRPTGAAVAKLGAAADVDAPVLDLALEAQLRAKAPLASRLAHKTFEMALTGDMAAYSWGLKTSAPILVDKGDRVEVTMRNDTMMAHPMHLHGHRFQVVAIDGQRFQGAVRDTVLVPPMRSITIAVDAVNPGKWAFHCHHLYHMASGMMSTFAYRS
ncbi:multicopper oxidase family protein [Mesorhizobium sp. M4B.F.Ca.ET.190.01.1.1]|uniref:multicopper oxidase family protein n=1 Tax=unclassified Mesorhizobium TaxID=325217 RepID=UPI0010929317|nr:MULTISPECIES: multicopper oxidase family protein [unclassified Mesorhizobium]TGR08355.1 multicopper oxidase family protein [Mesorhizobium sp. M4B.F.Ca.ET.200.01.1.1]TGS17712.1 multicopper oxidase family protein [Mesorhizobium sp. M4B.F.Ca.ET.190.01.1.1]TGT30037.1 multicopper oxidase family protein [Mesorhizobium sp. M4B.F.Ca.ET.172.01.1.1]TJW01103.1 MAG: multicopper oxidase family protein [Mesorhizobium sp.]